MEREWGRERERKQERERGGRESPHAVFDHLSYFVNHGSNLSTLCHNITVTLYPTTRCPVLAVANFLFSVR